MEDSSSKFTNQQFIRLLYRFQAIYKTTHTIRNTDLFSVDVCKKAVVGGGRTASRAKVISTPRRILLTSHSTIYFFGCYWIWRGELPDSKTTSSSASDSVVVIRLYRTALQSRLRNFFFCYPLRGLWFREKWRRQFWCKYTASCTLCCHIAWWMCWMKDNIS